MARSSLRRRLILSFVGLAVVPLLVAAVISGWHEYQQSLDNSRARQQELAQRVKVQVESKFQQIETILVTTLNTTLFDQLDRVTRHAVLGDTLSQRHLFRDATFITSDGEVQLRLSNVRVTDEQLPLSRLEQQVLRETIDSASIYYGEVYFDASDREPLITVGIPVTHRKTGEILGVVSIELRFKEIWNLFSQLRIAEGEDVYIIDSHGLVVAHPNPSLVLRQSRVTVGNELLTSGLEQQDVVMVSDNFLLGDREFTIVVERAAQIVFNRAYSQLWNLLLIVMVSIVAALLIFFLVSRYLLRPITAISHAATAIREGDWKHKVVLEQQDELGEMAAAFNSMTQRLTDTLAKLEAENAQRARAEKKLASAKERLETVTQFESDWIYWRNEDKNQFYYISPTCETFTGYSVEEFEHDPGLLDSILHPEDRSRWETHEHKLDSANNLIPEEFRIITKSGEIRWISHTCRPVIRDNGERDGRRGSNQEITERKRMQELMVQTEKMMSVGGLAAGMAHELNNPLGGILQGVQNINRRLSGDLNKNIRVAEDVGLDLALVSEYLDKRGIMSMLQGITEAGQRAAAIVENMLKFSRKSEVVLYPEDLVTLIDNAIELAQVDYDMKKRYDFRNIEIVREYDPSIGLVPCIKAEIQQVLLNLFRNAAQAMQKKEGMGVAQKITVRTSLCSEMACIEVEDNGTGMDEDVRSRVFEPFFTTSEVGEGTGLGLSVSYFIVTQEHRGTMSVESHPGIGTKFTVCLPASHV